MLFVQILYDKNIDFDTKNFFSRSKKVTYCLSKNTQGYLNYPQEWNISLDQERTCVKRYGQRSLREYAREDQLWHIRWAKENNINRIGRTICDLRNYMLTQPHFTRRGIPIGPIVTAQEIPLLVECLTQADTMEEKMILYQQYIDVVCNAASINNPLYSEFEEAYSITIQKAEALLQYRKRKKEDNSETWKAMKLNVATKFVETIKKQINNPIHNHILSYRINRDFICCSKARRREKQFPIIMRKRWVNNYMIHYLAKPSKVSLKKMKEIASHIECLADGPFSNIEQDEIHTQELHRHEFFHSYRPSWYPERTRRQWQFVRGDPSIRRNIT